MKTSKLTANIPNSITCLNVLAGSAAILFAAKGHALIGGLSGIQWAWILIGIAAVADFCDGLAARTLHAYSDMGKELDSLCDVVSFGVAPAAILHFALPQESWQSWLPLLIPVAAALRLAKFNIDTRQTTSFLGLPVPANAIFWIGYSALATGSMPWLSAWYWALPFILLLSWLMVSEVKLFSLKLHSLRPSECWRQLTLVCAAVVLALTLGVGGLAWLIAFYVGFSLATPSSKTAAPSGQSNS